ncbi:hypothetical protein MAPG_02972 [Magnaporthiopsis poae ATCC 64411]|uniref:Trichothecene 3-O-acetyltransferase-like N-terminal domain-containing protein n=1 Tax=Magnaporthiopsis poae (strain ATCC 64411 / 73-15) TaxID=644358 RepID=A0A0C4DST1_MAGP6|nr:hypothetical protein MAPG_02972 [Magnaporthiopsis poae ATCC 64411]
MERTEDAEIASERARTTVILSPWNQAGARIFFSPGHCYPLDNSLAREAIDTIREYLDVLALARPETAGRISAVQDPTQKGMLTLTMDPVNDRIPLDVLYEEDTFGQTYEELKAKGFPPSAFVHPRFGYDGGPHSVEDATRPTFRVLAIIIKGGLILTYYFHHSVFDGVCMQKIYECLESISRGKVPVATPSQDTSFIPYDPIKNDDELARLDPTKFPELDLPHFLGLLPREEALGPQVGDFKLEANGRQFRFRNDKLKELQELVMAGDKTGGGGAGVRTPSSYMCLAALTWSHICKARSAAEVLKYRGTNPASAHLPAPPAPRMIVPVNWSQLLAQQSEKPHEAPLYFGNTSYGTMVEIESASQLLDACTDPSALASVVRKVEADVAAQRNWEAVAARTALYARVGDVSRIGWRIDPLSAADTVVNTWRFLGGADMRWQGVPGLMSERPDAVRRCAAKWSTGYACVMPGRVDADFRDLLVMLPTKEAMEALCRDEEWMQWVDSVLE